MHRLAVVLVALVAWAFAPACTITINTEDVSGSGNVVVRTFTVDEFDRIDISGAFEADVTVVPDESQRVEILADDNFFDDIEVGVNGRTLTIEVRNGIQFKSRTDLKATIAVPSLRAIEASGATEVDLDAGDTDVEDMDLSGASRLDVVALAAPNLRIDVSGASTLRVAGSRTLDASIDASGASEVDLTNLPLDRAALDVSGASRARLGPTGEVTGDLSGASSLSVPASADVNVDTSGASSIDTY